MPDLTRREKLAKASLYDIGYKYLCTNFRKFNERNKIKVAIAILQIFERDDSKTKIPTEMKIIVEIVNENKTTPNAGNRISQYIEV